MKKKNKVSSHFLISQKGDIFNLVDEGKRAWHAGQSYWVSKTDLNSMSIGIELDYSPNHSNNKFSNLLLSSLIRLILYLKKKYKIDKKCILGHSDIAPYRKIDPGDKFPWKKLIKKELAYHPKKVDLNKINKIRKWFKKNKINSKKLQILFMLNYIGYDTSKALKNNYFYTRLIYNYKSHYFQKNNANHNKVAYKKSIELHFANLILTKLKKENN